MPKEPVLRQTFKYFHEMTTRWRDNDVYHHVNNAVFYEYVDTAVNVWLQRESGLDVPRSDIVGLVVNSSCDFYAPLVFPEPVTGGMGVVKIGNSSVQYRVGLFAGLSDVAAADALFTHVYVDKDTRRPVALPDMFKAALGTVLI